MKKKIDKPIKGDFSDKAKREAAVNVGGFEAEIARLKAWSEAEIIARENKISAGYGAMREALTALADGRRGDAAKILRAALPQPAGQPTSPFPPSPKSA